MLPAVLPGLQRDAEGIVIRTDQATQQVTAGIVVAVGLVAGGDSYSHIFHLAREHHQDVVSAALVPLAGDGLVVAASVTMLAAARNGKPDPARSRRLRWCPWGMRFPHPEAQRRASR